MKNQNIKNSLKTLNQKNLGVLIVRNQKNQTTGIFTDGDMKRTIQKNINLEKNYLKSFMTKNPISIEKDTLVVTALNLMNEKKITTLCVHKKKDPKKTIGTLHIHNILSSNIS